MTRRLNITNDLTPLELIRYKQCCADFGTQFDEGFVFYTTDMSLGAGHENVYSDIDIDVELPFVFDKLHMRVITDEDHELDVF